MVHISTPMHLYTWYFGVLGARPLPPAPFLGRLYCWRWQWLKFGVEGGELRLCWVFVVSNWDVQSWINSVFV